MNQFNFKNSLANQGAVQNQDMVSLNESLRGIENPCPRCEALKEKLQLAQERIELLLRAVDPAPEPIE